ncbi:MAG: hypothetical protein HRT69_17955 [Flavobacteriaceae bacterium]|nr:hypothetical protein [Flavobacteriaceae bacterium]
MKTKPILFNTEMVAAISNEIKTQTRRTVKLDKYYNDYELSIEVRGDLFQLFLNRPTMGVTRWHFAENIKPKYNIGDVMWVRETWQYSDDLDSPYLYKQKYQDEHIPEVFRRMKWKPSIHMPKSVCRTFLEVTNVRVERLNDISEEDSKKEGVKKSDKYWLNYIDEMYATTQFIYNLNTAKESFKTLWSLIGGNDSWKANPFVFVYEFKKVKRPLRFLMTEQPTTDEDGNTWCNCSTPELVSSGVSDRQAYCLTCTEYWYN